jgi:enamine deaminase RidA (YjgF/YER057c/UK114 family)
MNQTSSVEARLAELGIELPEPPRPLGAYTPAVQAGHLLFLSGMLPLRHGSPAYTGIIGLELDVAMAQDAVRLAVLNGLSAARAHLGTLDAIRRVVRVAVYQRAIPEFVEHAKVADAASELLHRLFGPAEAHTRMVFGLSSLPASMPVEVELVCEVASGSGIERDIAIPAALGLPVISRSVKHGGIVYLCGVTPDPAGSIAEQTRQVLRRIDRLLAAAGTNRSKLLSAQVWLADMSLFAAHNEVWNEWVDHENPPARACVQAGLFREGVLVEIMVTAAA